MHMTMKWIRLGAVALLTGAMLSPVAHARGAAPQGGTQTDDALVAKARAIHDRVITLDTHNDINPSNFTADRNYTQDLGNQVNLPKMFAGGLDASFFIVYVGQNSTSDRTAGRRRSRRQATTRPTRKPSPSSTPSTGCASRSRPTESAWP